MTHGRVRALAAGSFAVSALLSAGAAVFLVLAWDVPLRPAEFGVKGYAIAWSLVVGGVGAVLASRRPSNPIGWILCVVGILAGVLAFTSEYARWALIDRHGRPSGGLYAAWVVEWLWIPMAGGMGLVAALFPDGRFLPGRWRRVAWASIAATAIPVVGSALIPHLIIYEGFDNPVGIGGEWLTDAAGISTVLLIPLMFVGAGSVVHRLRRARGEERQQVRWLALAISFVAAMLGVYAYLVLTHGTSGPTGEGLKWLEYLTILSFLAVPVAIAFGVLKYRLYDIDIVIDKAVVYGGLAAFITGVYLVVVIATGSLTGYASNPVLSAIAAAIVAVAFQPMRRRAQRLANRIVYGQRATPYEVLSELSTRFAETYSLEDALPRLARVTAEAVGAESAAVWLRSGGELHRAATWPAEGDATPTALEAGELPAREDRAIAFEVRDRGEPLGALSVLMPANESLDAAATKLLGDVAGQAGLVLRNVALLEDLRASRQRIVAAQDERARKLERDVHDGAQQQLVALAVKLRLADSMVGRDEGRAHALLAEVQAQTTDALENLRDLARGIYPPLLADKGLGAALDAQARKSGLPVRVETDGIGRYRQDVEAAVYFCVLEALQNVAKYANASVVEISLAERGGEVAFEVRDDGVGFDPAAATGSGLTNMRDRLEALGGSLEIASADGAGTTIRGRVPVPAGGGST